MSSNNLNKKPLSGSNTPNMCKSNKDKSILPKCWECKKEFSSKFHLKRHFISIHPEKKFPEKEFKFHCKDCKYKFNHRNHLYAHQRSKHGQGVVNKKLHQCFLCRIELIKKDLMNHYATEHDIDTKEESLSFSTYEEVVKWKETLEKESSIKFIVNAGTRNINGVKHHSFKCYRSGQYNSKSAGVRRPRIHGSIKTNFLCPSTIKIMEYADGSCLVKYVKTHVGHDMELKHLNLPTAKITKTISRKLSKQIPLNVILENIKDSVSEFGNLQRSHLLTKQNIIDIENSFRLEDTKCTDDATSIDMWVQDVQESISESFVLLYKPLGIEIEQVPCLKSDDLVLVVMNQAQNEMLKKYGFECVCVDGTHGLNENGFLLITLMVVDDKREGFPCAFLICNRLEEEVVEVFFRCIKEESGVITPAIFMSDVSDLFYNAWCYAMGNPKQHLYCTWHVDRAWLKDLSKIKEKEKQMMVYKLLRTLLEERDENTVASTLESSLSQLSAHGDTSAFAEHFKEHYLKTITQWAFCYRLHFGLNAIVHLERMHKTLEYIYLKGKSVKRLDKAIDTLMQLFRNKILQSNIIHNRSKLSAQLKNLRKVHLEIYNISTTIRECEEGWSVLNSVSKKSHIVQCNKIVCCSGCKLICKYCDVCIHKYICSCYENANKWNMCQHIHSVCMSLKNILGNSSSSIKDASGDVNIGYEITNDEYFLQPLQSASLDTIENEKLKMGYNEIIDFCTTTRQLEYLRENLSNLKTALAAIENHTPQHTMHKSEP